MDDLIDFSSEVFRALKRENEQVLSNIANNGCYLTKEVEIIFESQYATIDAAKAARTELRKLNTLPSTGLHMVCDYSKTKGYCSVELSVEMVPNVQALTEIEAKMRYIDHLLGGENVGWEFQDRS